MPALVIVVEEVLVLGPYVALGPFEHEREGVCGDIALAVTCLCAWVQGERDVLVFGEWEARRGDITDGRGVDGDRVLNIWAHSCSSSLLPGHASSQICHSAVRGTRVSVNKPNLAT